MAERFSLRLKLFYFRVKAIFEKFYIFQEFCFLKEINFFFKLFATFNNSTFQFDYRFDHTNKLNIILSEIILFSFEKRFNGGA